MARDGYTAVSACLGASEAEMIRGVLESAGIEVLVEGESIASLGLPAALGSATVLVPHADAERAREIASASGVFPGRDGEPDAEIDDEEWRRGAPGPDGARAIESAQGDGRDPDALARRALRAAALSLPLFFTLLAPLYAFAVATRFYGWGTPSSLGARLRAAAAVALAAFSLAAGAVFWAKVVPDLGRRGDPPASGVPGRPLPAPRPPFP